MAAQAGGGGATLGAPPGVGGVSLQGFRFSYRQGRLEWRLLHGIDPDAVVKLTDVRAVQDCLQTLQTGSFETEGTLSSKNCVQVFRLLQLAIEYVWHLRNAHTSLLEAYSVAVLAADRWKGGANLFLDTGAAFVSNCMASGDINREGLEQVDDARSRMEQLDRLYNQALDRLEDEDQRARYFHFRKQRAELNWQQLCSIDLDAMIANTDTAHLDKVMHNLVFGTITSEDREELTPHHFAQLIPLAQAALDYMLFQANGSGSALERSMITLQAACVEIPALTNATQQLHTRITNFILEAQSQAAQLAGMAGITQPTGGMMSMQSAQGGGLNMVLPAMAALDPGASMSRLAPQVGILGSMAASLARSQQGAQLQGPLDMAGNTHLYSSALAQHGGGPGGALRPMLLRNYGAATGGVQSQQLGSPPGALPSQAAWGSANPHMGAYAEALALAATAAATGPALEMQAKAVEMHFRMETLESDIKMERTKAEELRKMLADIRDRVVVGAGEGRPSTPPPGGIGAPGTAGDGGAWSSSAAPPAQARARMPSMSGTGELRARAARQRTKGHRPTDSTSQAMPDISQLAGELLEEAPHGDNMQRPTGGAGLAVKGRMGSRGGGQAGSRQAPRSGAGTPSHSRTPSNMPALAGALNDLGDAS